jgi:hypothetical protein
VKWFRLYHDILDDPKVQRMPAAMFKRWINLLCLASRQRKRGTLPPVHEVAYALRLPVPEAERTLQYLYHRTLLDLGENECYSIHNWAKWQPEWQDDTLRQRRRRERLSRDTSRDNHVTVTPSDTEEKRIDKRRVEEKRGESERREEEKEQGMNFITPEELKQSRERLARLATEILNPREKENP